MNKRHFKILNSIGSGAFDIDANAFIVASGITDIIQKQAINTFVVGLKKAGIWTKFDAIYPLIGGTATSHKFNLKDPRDLDTSFRLSFSGGWTHSANGAKANGTNAYADTFVRVGYLNTNACSLGVYFRENIKRNEAQLGYYNLATFTASEVGVAYSTSSKALIGNQSSQKFTANTYTNVNGFNRNNRVSSSAYKIFRNGILFEIMSDSSIVDTSTQTFTLGAERSSNGTIGKYSDKTFCYADISTSNSLTDSDELTYYNLIQALQTTLNRQV